MKAAASRPSWAASTRTTRKSAWSDASLLLGVLVLVSLAGDADTDFTRDVSDSGSPDLTVKVGVHAHFLNAREKLTSALIISVSPCYADCLEGGDNCQIWRAEAKLTLVNISLVANLLMFLIARGALFLNWMP